ncbi:uncharacterized protein LOC102705680 [Oryza brachyantha]|uniref:uncharacterized protein LOC102705680 n=1 Tax=Oryza brachyantha TaxID=4533 RepID=UPI001ADC1F2C|nr:uncharacterized protein LOC102705680 [Oryza brachyantha]
MAVYILNRSPAKALDGRTPYEAWHGRKPAVSHLRVFSCLAFTKQLGHIGKLDDRSTLGVFIGYAKGLKAYRILDPETPYENLIRKSLDSRRNYEDQGIAIIVKFGSFIGMVVPVVLSILPYFYHVYTGSFSRTTDLYGALAMLGGLINSIIWLVYADVTSKNDLSLGLLLMHAFLCMSLFCYLMHICAYRRAIKMGYALGALFIISVSIIFFVVNWDANPSEFVKWLFGAFGILSLVICHWIQLEDILHGVAERSQRIVTIIDIVPSCIMTVVSFVITFHTHPEHILILVSSAIGFILNLAEILLLINFATVGYLFPLAVNTNADVEPARQSDQPATQDMKSMKSGPLRDLYIPVLLQASGMAAAEPHPMLLRDLEIHYWMVISKLYRTRSATPFHPRRALADTLPLEENASKIPDIDDSIAVLILQVRNIYEIHEVRPMLNLNLHTRAAIPWMNMQIERDLYITMLLQASGMAAAEPHPMILRDLEIHHLMVISKLYCTRSATPFQPRRALAGIVPLEESVSMIPDTDDSIAVLILQVRNRYEIYEVRPMLNLNFQTRVLLVEAIPRMNMQIERDLYIPMLLQASGMAAAEPHPMLLRDLEIHYWMVISKLYRTRSATPFHPRRALAGH